MALNVSEGFDAFLIGNIADPGLYEAREVATMPVLGLCTAWLDGKALPETGVIVENPVQHQ